MKIEKTVCDICGGDIKIPHPMRIEVLEYAIENYPPMYKKAARFDVCDSCLGKVGELFKAAKEGK